LCLATTVILKMQLSDESKTRKPALALLTFIPLLWLLAVTMTAGYQKIASPNTRIGFLSFAAELKTKTPGLEQAVTSAKTLNNQDALLAAESALKKNQVLIFNQYLDATVAALFLALVSIITLLSFWQWYQLLTRRRAPELQEEPAEYLPDYAVVEGRPVKLAGVAALSLALMKELSGEADMERASQTQLASACCNEHSPSTTDSDRYLEHLDARYKSIRRCC
ncbi:MAG: carbon starvation protein A, partial [Verrucomicrobiota bacterium]